MTDDAGVEIEVTDTLTGFELPRVEHNMFPITYAGWDAISVADVQMYDVVFTADFGPMNEGDKAQVVEIDSLEGLMKVFRCSESQEPDVTIEIACVVKPKKLAGSVAQVPGPNYLPPDQWYKEPKKGG